MDNEKEATETVGMGLMGLMGAWGACNWNGKGLKVFWNESLSIVNCQLSIVH